MDSAAVRLLVTVRAWAVEAWGDMDRYTGRILKSASRELRSARRWLVKYRAELLDAAGILVGWSMTTWAVGRLLSWVVAALASLPWWTLPSFPEVSFWALSGGILVLGLVGRRHLATILKEGLYTLTRDGGR